MRSFLPLAAAIGLSLLCASCGGGREERPKPLPTAWHRIEMPDSAYREVSAEGVAMQVNSGAVTAETQREDGVWIDISYPTFPSARVYLTLNRLRPGEIHDAVANRLQRITLNTGGLPTERLEFTNPAGWECLLTLTPSSVTTPVQAVATGGDGRILSATLYISVPQHTDPDSVAPVVDAVRRDMTVMLNGLR